MGGEKLPPPRGPSKPGDDRPRGGGPRPATTQDLATQCPRPQDEAMDQGHAAPQAATTANHTSYRQARGQAQCRRDHNRQAHCRQVHNHPPRCPTATLEKAAVKPPAATTTTTAKNTTAKTTTAVALPPPPGAAAMEARTRPSSGRERAKGRGHAGGDVSLYLSGSACLPVSLLKFSPS